MQKEQLLDSAFQYLRNTGNDSVQRNLYFKIADAYYNLDKSGKYFTVTNRVYQLARQSKDTLHLAKSLYYLGDFYYDKTQLDSAFSYYMQSQKMYRHLNDTLNSGKLSLEKARILYDTGNFTESVNQGITALKMLSRTGNTRQVYESYIVIALCLKELNDYQNSLDYFNQALNELAKLEKDSDYPKAKVLNSRASCYNNIGTIYEKLGNYEKAIELYNEALNISGIKTERPELYAMLLSNLAYSKMKSGDNAEVEKLLFSSLKIRDSLQTLPGIVSGKIRIGEYYLFQKDTVKALAFIKDGYRLSRKIKSGPEIIYSLKLLTENDNRNKTYYSNLYFKVSDSIQNAERSTHNKFARIAYETDQIKEENQLLSRRNKVVLTVSIGIIFFSIVLFVIFRLRSKNKELLFIKDQQDANETIYQLMLKQQWQTEEARNEERNRIAMELHDGIVNSVFTTRFNLMQLDTGSADKKDQLIRELEKTENEIRRVSHDLQQNLLFEDKNLPEILVNFVSSQQNHFHTRFDLSVDKYIDWSQVSGAGKIHIYRIIQEAVQNINKYSKAERCFIILLKTGDKITIRIWDNGIGFNPSKVREGIGLKNIRKRSEALNGQLRIASDSKTGTTIEVVF
ncbi:MAG TPA: tetratricopeptide repeat protein [Flavobacterium sp.]|nr:tetratricopeptide repeat protein [Flavobacterium sp.]